MARCFVELHRTSGGGVEGVLIPEETGDPEPFSGWLELLRLLEVMCSPPDERAPDPAS